MKTTLQKIREIAEEMVQTDVWRDNIYKIRKILSLCDQAPQDPVITNPWSHWVKKDSRKLDDLLAEYVNCFMNANCDETVKRNNMLEYIQEILTRPKEKELWVYWKEGWEIVKTYEENPIGPGEPYIAVQTTNAQIKEIGVMVEDWQRLVDEGEIG